MNVRNDLPTAMMASASMAEKVTPNAATNIASAGEGTVCLFTVQTIWRIYFKDT